jgi:protein involved in polysaccharide export with SLBB domain
MLFAISGPVKNPAIYFISKNENLKEKIMKWF